MIAKCLRVLYNLNDSATGMIVIDGILVTMKRKEQVNLK